MLGDRVIVATVAPVFHVYELAPLAVKVAVPLAQIVAELTLITGKGFTVTVDVAEFLQPVAFVPITV